MRNIVVGLGVTLVIGLAIVLFIQISATISANKAAKILENEDDYGQGNVPLVSSFLPVNATELTTCCHHIYQLGDLK